jgi:hypothetical protein
VKPNDYDKRLHRIELALNSIDKTLAVNTEHLADHIRRTRILEEEIKPISKHVQQMQGAGKLIALLALLATIASVISFVK